jgi:hypothetical protein
LAKDLLAKKSLTALENPPYSLVLASAGFYLYRRLKSALQGQRFHNFTDILKSDGRAEKAFTNDCRECFQHLCSRWQTCIFTQGDSLKEMFLK